MFRLLILWIFNMALATAQAASGGWKEVATQMLGPLAPDVIQRLDAINPNYDWSGPIRAYVPALNAAYGTDWMDPARGSSAGIVSALLQNAQADGQGWAASALPAAQDAQRSQEAQILAGQKKSNDGLFGDLGPVAQIAALIPGPQQPFLLGANALNAASQGNYVTALLNAGGAAYTGNVGGFADGLNSTMSQLAEHMGWSTPTGPVAGADAPWGVNPSSGPSPGMEDYADRLAAEDFAGGQQYLANTGQSYEQFLRSTLPALASAGVGAAALSTVTKAVAAGSTLDNALKLAGIAAPIVGAALGSNAINRASNAQLSASDRATQVLQDQFNTTRADLAPWREAGVNALNDITAGLKPGGEFTNTFTSPEFNFQEDPGYQFRLEEGEKAIARAAAARGMNNSGATYKDLLRFGQNTASDEYSKAFNRFDTNRAFDYNKFVNDQATKFNRQASVAGIGQTATNSLINAGANTASQVSNNITNAGNVNAGATIAGVNALNSGIGSALTNYTNQTNNAAILDLLRQSQGRTPTIGSQ